MNVHLDLHEAHFLLGLRRFAHRHRLIASSCTRQMHVHLIVLRMNVHPVLHLHGISGTM
jgi:hypothetical protein